MFAMSYHGANKVVPTYSLMGAGEGRARGVLPLPSRTSSAGKASACTPFRRARSRRGRHRASRDFDLLLNEVAKRAPMGELVDIMDVGFTCAFLATPYARRLSGETLYVDGGVNIMA